ncbi:parvalbumin, thymic-like [Mobula birostris]|uniref:parvalbumin, thymic-like n=1 Tax=Mobula birostris TaxID=1983395 RepID=UPI003B27DD7F
MSITDFLVAGDVAAALAECSDPGSFHFKKFSETFGLAKKSPEEITKIFTILDDDRSGFIEKRELNLFLRCFCPQAGSVAETDSFVSVADENDDGRIDCAEFRSLVTSMDQI